jgi:hypothetical protein
MLFTYIVELQRSVRTIEGGVAGLGMVDEADYQSPRRYLELPHYYAQEQDGHVVLANTSDRCFSFLNVLL